VSAKPTAAQEGSAYNGHFSCTCYRPLFVFNQFGDLERCALRPGKVHSADGWRGMGTRCSGATSDAVIASPEVWELLEVEG
jgi:hypothetical protein